jgi:hypothetical protein
MTAARSGGNVIPLRPRPADGIHMSTAFDQLTAAVIMERHRRGELDPAVLVALLAGVGLQVPQ